MRAAERRGVRTWLLAGLTLAMAATALGIYAASLSELAPFDPDFSPPWWMLAPLFFLAEVAVVHLPLGRQTLSFTLVEIPVVLGLFLAAPSDLIFAQLLGAGVALLVHRRLNPTKLAFNLANYALGTAVAVTVFRSIAHPGDVGAMTWLAAYLATAAMTIVGAVAISAGMSIAEWKPQLEALARGSLLGLTTALLNTSAGLIGVLLLDVTPYAIVLVLVPSAILLIAYRSLAARQREDRSVRFLYGSMRAIEAAEDTATMLRSLVSRLRETFRAELAEIVLFPGASWLGVRSALLPGGDDGVLEETEMAPFDEQLKEFREPRLLISGREIDEDLRSWMSHRGLREAMVVPVRGQERDVGCIIVADRRSDQEGFDGRDLELVQTLAHQTGLAIERAQMLDRLRDSLREVGSLATIVRSSPDAIISWTPEGTIATWNPGAEHLFGLSAREAVGQPATILVPSEQEVGFAANLTHALEGDRLEEETEYVLTDGSRVPVSLRMSPIHDVDGRIVGATSIIRDERDRRRREQELRRSEERFRKVFEEGSVGMVLSDLDLKILRANRAFCQLVGYTQERLRGVPLDTLVHVVGTNGSPGPERQGIPDRSVGGERDARLMTSSGSVLLVHTSAWPIHDGEDARSSVLTMVEDVTERALGEQRLRETEARFRRVVLALAGLRDRGMVLQAVADAARELTSADYALVSVADPGGDKIEASVLSGVDAAASEWLDRGESPAVKSFERWVVAAIRQARLIRDPELGESLAAASVPVRPGTTSLLGVPIAHGEQALGYLLLASRGGVTFDASDEQVAAAFASQAVVAIENARVHAENVELVERLRGVSSRLRRANALKSDFLANLSHELKTPLSTILLASDVMRDPSNELPRSRARQWSERVHSNASHMLSLVDNLVDLSMIEAGRLDLTVRSVPVVSLIEDAMAVVGPIADERDITLELATHVDARIQADALRARQVLLNLLSNAIKFTPPGGRVWVDVTRSDEEVTVAVHDTGIGIARRDLERILEPFERAAKDAGPGAGLGLAISADIMRLLDGRLDISSAPGKGSTFAAVFAPGASGEDPAAPLGNDSGATNGRTRVAEEDLPSEAPLPIRRRGRGVSGVEAALVDGTGRPPNGRTSPAGVPRSAGKDTG